MPSSTSKSLFNVEAAFLKITPVTKEQSNVRQIFIPPQELIKKSLESLAAEDLPAASENYVTVESSTVHQTVHQESLSVKEKQCCLGQY